MKSCFRDFALLNFAIKILPVSKQLDSSLPFVNKKRLVVGMANGLAAQLNCDFVAVTNQPKIVPL